MEETGTHVIEWRRLDDDLELEHWRTERLIALGYSLHRASALASSRVDVHELERLIGTGCPLDTAIRIAA